MFFISSNFEQGVSFISFLFLFFYLMFSLTPRAQSSLEAKHKFNKPVIPKLAPITKLPPKPPVPIEKLPVIEVERKDRNGKIIKRKYAFYDQRLQNGKINRFLYPIDSPSDDDKKKDKKKTMFILIVGSTILTLILSLLFTSYKK
jgi:hypothetical protein